MIGLLHFSTLVITTVFAAGAAALVNWLLLRATFQLMRPATAGQVSSGGSGKVRRVWVWFPGLCKSLVRTRGVSRPIGPKNFICSKTERKKGATSCWL